MPLEAAATASISLVDSAILGVVEGLTEFLPVSSTGHLILTSSLLGLDLEEPAITAFLVVIQAGALLALAGLYRTQVTAMALGLAGKSAQGLRLLGKLILAFVPAGLAALLFQAPIKELLFKPVPVGLALGVGGVAMIVVERLRREAGGVEKPRPLEIADLTWRMALIIGLAQCLALWPGTSRSMVTIVAGISLGLSPRAAAEFSFLLALPTLGAATVYDLIGEGSAIVQSTGAAGLIAGFGLSCVVAAVAMRGFLHYLTRHGLELFGYYRIVLAVIVVVAWNR